jgi:PilZ domain
MEASVQNGNRHYNQFPTCGLMKGSTVDTSESGIAATLTSEASAGEIVELIFTLPDGPVTVCATVRHNDAFRYGFEFVVPNGVSETIRRTCRNLVVEQTLFAGPKM